ncbi:gastrula zinc finger protein xFG20-1 [Drosophila santomea]|uniref:gastrula zinc finger protein xFG20-1 n=1 Tax=Drosophila santomea TaxID=129105 RepID=UPI001952FFC5|nr:gastrula zinc finger protein xFG20-1 [Drosophila santomea]
MYPTLAVSRRHFSLVLLWEEERSEMENRRCTVVAVGDLLGELDFCCDWCGKVYKSLVRYHNHIIYTHKLPVPEHQWFNCFHCPLSDCRFHQHGPGVQVFRQIGKLRRHYQERHMTGLHTCESCKKQYRLKSALVSHSCRRRQPPISDSQSAIILRRHVCFVCKKSYQHLGALQRHISCSKHGTPDTLTEDRKDNRNKEQSLLSNKEFFATQRCPEQTDQNLQCDRVSFSKWSLESHSMSSCHLQAEDCRFLVEMEQLVRGIDDGTVQDPLLLKELSSLLPVLRQIQDSDLEIK